VAQRLPEQAQGAADRGHWVWIPETTESGWLLAELLAQFRHHRKRLAVVFVAVAALAFAATFAMPVQYLSTAVLSPVSSSAASPFGAIASQLSGLAGLTGIKAPDASGDRTIVTIATLQSRGFLVDFANRHGLVPRLFPWRYDESTQRWKAAIWPLRRGVPSEDEIFNAMEGVVEVVQDPLTGLVTVSMLDRSPELANSLAADFIREINERMRLIEVKEAEQSIGHLKREIAGTEVAELRQVFYGLIEERTKSALLANVSDEFALRTVDPPSHPDRPAKPRRFLVAVLAAVLGVILCSVWILLRFALRPYRAAD
jgi:LPS O-antigen subunit length determinant protein (WzzB/FepE family)